MAQYDLPGDIDHENCANCNAVITSSTACDNDDELGEIFDTDTGRRFLCEKCYRLLYLED